MKLGAKGRYAVTAILDLALHEGVKRVSLAEIAERQCLSLSYLEQLFAKLRAAGLVSSARGPGGGYMLARPASDINVLDVILSVEENIDMRQCKGEANCAESKQCLTHELWSELSYKIQDFLTEVTIGSLVNQYQQHPNQTEFTVPLSNVI